MVGIYPSGVMVSNTFFLPLSLFQQLSSAIKVSAKGKGLVIFL